MYVCKQKFHKLYRYITREFIGLRMPNFQDSIFIWTRTYRQIFKSALVYLMFCSTNIWNLIKTRRDRKWKIPHTVLEKWTICFSLYKNCKIKVKLWWIGDHQGKERVFFVTFILSEEIFFNVMTLLTLINVLR